MSDVHRPMESILKRKVIAVVRAASADEAVAAACALFAGGITALEITFTTPAAHVAIQRLRGDLGEDAFVGAGTVRTRRDVQLATDAGAQFLVAPGMQLPLLTAMRMSGIPTLVGALTPSEIMAAVDGGADMVKLFPASLGGPKYLSAIRGPFPEVAFCPTGGVNERNIGEWFEAGAAAVGAGGDLCSPRLIDERDWRTIESNARSLVSAVNG